MSADISADGIAIIGMAGRFPGAANIETFWKNLCEGTESIRFPTEKKLESIGVEFAKLRDPNFVKASSCPDDIEWFDASFFGIPPAEAEIMDPQHRLFLECAWEALEDAGYAGEYEGRIGVYGGATMNTYLLCNLMRSPQLGKMDLLQLNVGNSPDFLTTRVSYKLNLKGPSHAIQCACSTSLVALHHACQSIFRDECDMALAGGASINLELRHGYIYTQGGVASPDGHCRAFDKRAQGTIFGSGVGVVMLKRAKDALRDGDCIHAIIKGSAVNNDGSTKVGYTAPSVNGQAAVIKEALSHAGVESRTIEYVEAHGTGTALGDPIEFQALAKAFGTARGRNTCGIGSVKSNIGHLDAAAGVTGLIKTVLALKNKRIPATLHFESPNPAIDFENTPFYVVAKLTEWKKMATPRRAGVSSFGVGGTNAHIVLEESPPIEHVASNRSWQALLLSARSGPALEKSAGNLAGYLKQNPGVNIADVAYTLQVGRRQFSHRRFVLCCHAQEGWAALEDDKGENTRAAIVERDDRPIVFMFPGQGSQYVRMGELLYKTERGFRETVEYCSMLLHRELGFDLNGVLYPTHDKFDESVGLINQTYVTQVALFVVEYALAKLLVSFGVRPEAMIGHSLGEYVAACLAGVFSLEDALRLVAVRGRLMQSVPRGAMLAAAISENEADAFVGREISLAAVNGPMQCVLSGEEEAINEVEHHFYGEGVACRRLLTSHAFHSHMVEPILARFGDELRRVKLHSPHIPYFSNLTGRWITAVEATSPDYWVQQLRQTVKFSDAIGGLIKDTRWVAIEVGPGNVLVQMAKRQARGAQDTSFFATLAEIGRDHLGLLLGQLWLKGASIRWSDLHSGEPRRRITLPTYPFERQRYWIEPKEYVGSANATSSDTDGQIDESPRLHERLGHASRPELSQASQERFHPRPKLKTLYIPPSTEIEGAVAAICSRVLGITEIGIDDNFFELGGDSLMALQVVDGLKRSFEVDVPIVVLHEHLTIRSLTVFLQSLNVGGGELDKQTVEEACPHDGVPRRKNFQQRRRNKESELRS